VEKVIEGEGKTRRGSRQGEERREKRREWRSHLALSRKLGGHENAYRTLCISSDSLQTVYLQRHLSGQQKRKVLPLLILSWYWPQSIPTTESVFQTHFPLFQESEVHKAKRPCKRFKWHSHDHHGLNCKGHEVDSVFSSSPKQAILLTWHVPHIILHTSPSTKELSHSERGLVEGLRK
jgi:hypothetical protein